MGAWVKPQYLGSIQPCLSQDQGGYGRQVGLDTRGGGIGWSAFCGSAGVLGAVPAFQDKWTFVAAVYDQTGQTVRLQVDDLVLTATGVSLGAGLNQLWIGANPLFGDYFRGIIDNVFVFGDALTDQQLAYLRSRGAQAFRKPNPGLLLLLMD